MISDRSVRACLEQFRLAVGPEAQGAFELQTLLDASLSMTSGDGSKDQRSRELALLLLRLSEQAGVRGSVSALRGWQRNRTFSPEDTAKLVQTPFDGVEPLPECWQSDLLRSTSPTWRVIVSDFLFPADPAALVAQAGAGTLRLWLVQLLDESERHPAPSGPTALVDIETEQRVELMLDQATIDGYTTALTVLCDRWSAACQAAGAVWITTVATAELSAICRDLLVPAELLSLRESV